MANNKMVIIIGVGSFDLILICSFIQTQIFLLLQTQEAQILVPLLLLLLNNVLLCLFIEQI